VKKFARLKINQPLCHASGHDGGGRGREGELKEEGGVDRTHLQTFGVDEPRPETENRVRAGIRSVTQAVTETPVSNSALEVFKDYIIPVFPV